MARNEEKQYGRLNRLILQQQRDEEAKKNPKRPHLASLSTASEIKRWLPTIKTDIDFYLKQSKVWCYPERKITEFNKEIDKLRREHQAFVWRLRQLEPALDVLPGTDRPYRAPATNSCKHSPKTDSTVSGDKEGNPTKRVSPVDSTITSSKKKFKRIPLPILKSPLEEIYAHDTTIKRTDNIDTVKDSVEHQASPSVPDDATLPLTSNNSPTTNELYKTCMYLQDQPLRFNSHRHGIDSSNSEKDSIGSKHHIHHYDSMCSHTINQGSTPSVVSDLLQSIQRDKAQINKLGLDYATSSSDDDGDTGSKRT